MIMLSKLKSCYNAIVIKILINILMVNVGFLLAFLTRHLIKLGSAISRDNLHAYKGGFLFLTALYIVALASAGLFKKRFRSSWELFKKVFGGLFAGTLLSIAFIYVFRDRWGTFPTSVFAISFLYNLFLVTKANQYFLKAAKRIKKDVVILGKGKVDTIFTKKACVERKRIDQIRELLEYSNIDEIVISEKITDAKDLNLLLYLQQKLKAEILFSPSVYIELLPERINGNSSVELLRTFVGRRSELDEFLIRVLDFLASISILLVLCPVMILAALLIKLTSPGPVIYKQERVGKDGKTFTLYKFRTMVKNAEEISGFAPATVADLRITKIGKFLRKSRLDELPQLFNVLRGQMSIVGPRPENLHRVDEHKALQGMRLAVKPGLTGLAQVNNLYDLHPKHKIKYDYLYIQRRSFLLNLAILMKTIPVVFSRTGW